MIAIVSRARSVSRPGAHTLVIDGDRYWFSDQNECGYWFLELARAGAVVE